MPLSKPPVSCGLSLKALSQNPMVPGAKTRCPGMWASSHCAVLYSMVVRISMGRSQSRARAVLVHGDGHAGQRCSDPQAEGGAARNPRDPRPCQERQREPEGHVHFQVVAFRLRHQRELEPVAAQRGDADEQREEQRQSALPAARWKRAMAQASEQKGHCDGREVDALQCVGLEIVGHARRIGADHGDRRPATARAAARA